MPPASALLTRRVLALLLAGLYALSLTGSFLHQVLVQHVRCAEHGDLIHVADADRADHAAWTIVPDAAGTDTVDTGALDRGHSEDHDHDHCTIVAFSQTPTCTSEPRGGITPRLFELQDEALPPALAMRGVVVDADRYRLAPKGSPPA